MHKVTNFVLNVTEFYTFMDGFTAPRGCAEPEPPASLPKTL